LVALLVTTAYVTVIVNNVPCAFFNWNSPKNSNNLPVVISYPDSMFMPIFGNQTGLCTIKFLFQFNGTLSEGTDILVINATCMSYVPYNTVISVGFPQALPSSQKTTIGANTTLLTGWGGSTILTFNDNYTQNDSPFKPVADWHSVPPTYMVEPIYFPVSGDYYPIIEIANETDPYNAIVYSFDQIKIHVASATEVEGLRLNNLNLGLTIALFVFAWMGEIALMVELLSNARKEPQSAPIATSTILNSKNIAPNANSIQKGECSGLPKKPKDSISNATPIKNNKEPT